MFDMVEKTSNPRPQVDFKGFISYHKNNSRHMHGHYVKGAC